MKAVMVMFDSLNRRLLAPYGCSQPSGCDWVQSPNFQRLAEHACTFETSYVGSMPCMPARRELHTGRANFLHRSWGPLEPFDDSMPQQLREAGVLSHLISDHYHYWEEGGANYHTKYSSWEIVRGQEGDPWKGDLRLKELPESRNNERGGGSWLRQDWVNRSYMQAEADQPQPTTFRLGEEFLRANADEDNWFLHLETFDPHEPYFSPKRFHDLYRQYLQDYHWDWPPYAPVTQSPEEVRHMRAMSAALHTMCDEYLGRILDLMDELNLWDDTMLIVNTDHGFLLGEHDWWAKCTQPFYNEIANTPLFIWDPRSRVAGERRRSLVQTMDLPATILEYFGQDLPPDMQGRPLRDTIAHDTPVREAGLYGLFGAHVNVTDGRYTYLRANVTEDNTPLYEYTLMPAHMKAAFGVDELQDIQLQEPFSFTKGCRTMKVAGRSWRRASDFGTLLFDLQTDPAQEHPLDDPVVEQRMVDLLVGLMRKNDCPAEQYERLGLEQ
jgi:arylsulfatase A-like enzyme